MAHDMLSARPLPVSAGSAFHHRHIAEVADAQSQGICSPGTALVLLFTVAIPMVFDSCHCAIHSFQIRLRSSDLGPYGLERVSLRCRLLLRLDRGQDADRILGADRCIVDRTHLDLVSHDCWTAKGTSAGGNAKYRGAALRSRLEPTRKDVEIALHKMYCLRH